MTTTPETHVAGRDREPILESATSAPVLVTEQEVVLATAAAAVRTRPTTTRWWTEATSVVLEAIHRMFATAASGARPARRHYPKHYTFLEHACLAREMDRL
jgi:hypothetical protein